ncbi:UNVERIFIED_CONTAM: E3 ubiquitin-protein ligase Iruka [Sesamum latifolium]|uniref:E3 ubiquitin-protein ligase Iruka n=1 Tax=Sesamum latifolium TaxID=2727402 RepID=A0AAW2Y2Z9_9LAMI
MTYMLPVRPCTSISSSIHVRLRECPYRRQRSTSADPLGFNITVQVILQSSSSAVAGVLGYCTVYKFLAQPEEFLPEQCSDTVTKFIDLILAHWDAELRMHWRMAALRVLGKLRIEKGGGGDVAEWAEKPCPICLEELVKGDVIRLPCSHAYHEVCILTWIENHHACPYCRAKSPDINIDYEEMRRNDRFMPYLARRWETCSHVWQEMERLRRIHVGF